jgi:hypothetical protein
MGKLKTALMEVNDDDMSLGKTLSSEAKLVRTLIDEQDLTVSQAAVLGWSLHDIDTSIDRLSLFAGDLRPVSHELDKLVAKLIKVAQKAAK